MDEFRELLRKFGETLTSGPGTPLGRVLVIDDDPNIRQGLQRTLRDKNFVVFIATTGQEGLDLLSRDMCVVVLRQTPQDRRY